MREDELFGMMKIAKDQQAAVQAAITGLAAERAAMAKERAAMAAAMAEQAAAVRAATGDIRRAASAAIPAIERGAGEAVDVAMRECLVGTSEMAVTALQEASRPILGKLSSLTLAVGAAEGKLNDASASFGWKWITTAGATLAGTLAIFMLSAWLLTAWQRHQVASLVEEKVALQGEVAALQAQADALAKKGGRIKFSECGPGKRLCIEIAPRQGDAEGQTDFMGSWNRKDKDQVHQYVIPKGY